MEIGAEDSVVRVFFGQGFPDKISYIGDLGKIKTQSMQMSLDFVDEYGEVLDALDDTGWYYGYTAIIR